MDTKVKATTTTSSCSSALKQRWSTPLSTKANKGRTQCALFSAPLSSYIVVINISLLFITLCTIASQQPVAYALLQDQSLDLPTYPISTARSSVYNGPQVVILPSDPVFIVRAQSPADRTLTCKTVGDKPEMFTNLKWAGPNTKDNSLELSKKHNVIEEGPNVLELEFKNPTIDDAGTYYCLGTYQSSDNLNASVAVKVASPIKLENCPDRQFLVQGLPLKTKITCQISADQPRVTIWKDSKPIDQYGSRYRWDNNDGLVVNGEINQSDTGRYTIKVKSDLTGERRTQTIDVEAHTRPEMIYPDGRKQEDDEMAVDGEPAKLECNATGFPQPLIYWLDPKGRNVTKEGGYIVDFQQGTLQINKVKKEFDDGQFKCVAYNTVGEDRRSVSVTVYNRPQITLFSNQTAVEGELFTFECRAMAKPKPEFSIRRQGLNQMPLRVGDRVTLEEDTKAEGGVLDVYVYRVRVKAHRLLFGSYYCNATNKVGSAESMAQLSVAYKPDLSQTPSKQYVKLGRDIAVTCHIKAYPMPTVAWFIDNTQIVNPTTNTKVSPDGQTHVITMSPPSLQQVASSKFTCQAENTQGTDTQIIMPRYTTIPGVVQANIVQTTPTTAILQLDVQDDGGDRIRIFKYTLDGKSLDIFNPYYNYRDDRRNVTSIDASPSSSSNYTIRNLFPYYTYRMNVRAVNDVGEGGSTDITINTPKPTRPEPPVIIRHGVDSLNYNLGNYSEYNNGYLLKWSPPELDNGEPVLKYIIKYNKVDTNPLNMRFDSGHERVVEQMNDRPMYARLGPLEVNQRYKIQIQARNRIGDSDPDYIIIRIGGDRPSMPEFEAQTLAWLMEPSAPTLVAVIAMATLFLIIIDLIFCFCFQIGLSHKLRKTCCPVKANSVISDKL